MRKLIQCYDEFLNYKSTYFRYILTKRDIFYKMIINSLTQYYKKCIDIDYTSIPIIRIWISLIIESLKKLKESEDCLIKALWVEFEWLSFKRKVERYLD